jgi:general secretion pathway protein A
LLMELSNYLIARHLKKLTTVLVVDEAHHVSTEVLEEIRLLTNLETTQEKLLQILLVGQPELDEKLDSVELRQLKQRIALRSQLEPLNLEETRGYIHRRLELAGATPEGAQLLFPDDAMERIHRHSRGIPRLINTISENAMITSFAQQLRSVAPSVVDDVASDFRLGVVNAPPSEHSPKSDNSEALEAVKTLLNLHDYLKKMRSSEPEVAVPVTPRAQ